MRTRDAAGYGARMALLAPFASIRKMAAAAFPLVKPGLTLLPWLVRDKFDNLGKAPSLRCAKKNVTLPIREP